MNHSHNHHHDHNHNELSVKDKLSSLLDHWIDHNISHKESYLSWSEKARNEDLPKIVTCLENISRLTDQIDSELQKAKKSIS